MGDKSSTAGLDLLTLQGKIKRDAEGHQEEFDLQYRHYKACLDLFNLNPSKESREFADLVNFVAQVASCYPKETAEFHTEITKLLENHYAVLEPSLCRSLVQSLILLRNRGQVTPIQLLPLFFRLFRCNNKPLRQLLHRHIIADIKASNRKHRNDKLNRSVQNFLYSMLQDEHEAAAKKSLAVLTELYRRQIWRDAKTVNVIASAAFHKSSTLMLAAIKFFLGQDERDDNDDGEDPEEAAAATQRPTAKDYYNATKKGTVTTKKKKKKRLERVLAAVKKHENKKGALVHESFSAIQLLHDPQSFVERLFSRLRSSNERWETRVAMVQLISRIIGVHKLQLFNFYPFLQKYIAPHQRDETQILAALVQACHDMVPPEVMQPVLRQLVDQFVHDRARPEVVTIGIKTVREICSRMPLIMTEELLQELADYKKDRDKAVGTAARSLISLFRELCPTMLVKKDRGRGADLERQPEVFGATKIASRVDGAELLEEAIKRGDPLDSDDEALLDSDGEEAEGDEGVQGSDDEEADGLEGAEGEDSDGDVENDEAGSSDGEEDGAEGEEGSDVEGKVKADSDGEKEAKPVKKRQPAKADSLRALKAMAKAKAEAAEATKEAEEGEAEEVPLEMGRFLTDEDFEHIRRLKHKQLVEATMEKHGLKSANKRKTDAMQQKAEDDADNTLELLEGMNTLSQHRVEPGQLMGKHKKRKTKEERMESVLEGREGREAFGGSTSRNKNKMGGSSNKEKNKRKNIPIAARMQAIRKRAKGNAAKGRSNNFRGRKAYHQ